MPFKAGYNADLWWNGVDIGGYFASTAFQMKLETFDVTTFSNTPWKVYLAGLLSATQTASGYYDSLEADKVRATLTAAVGQLTYMPAGALALGDQARLLNVNSTDYKSGSKVTGPVALDFTAQSTAPVGLGNICALLQSYGVGAAVALAGEPTGLGNGGVQTTTGLVAHLHCTAMTGGDTHTFKLQDATTVGGAYTDIASGAFVNVTAVGSQRLVVPGTIRQFVRVMYTVAGHAATFGIAVART